MPKSKNQKLKILYLMKILLENTDEQHSLTMADLLEWLERYDITAERKSIYDDINALRDFGLDIEVTAKRPPAYYVASREFELPELKLLVDAVQSSRFITRKKSAELIKKIEGFTSVHEAHLLQRQVFVANRVKTENERIYYAVDTIHNAIGNNSKISFRYFEWNVRKEKQYRHDGGVYRVSPWALSWAEENYYLVAYDSEAGKIKHYRVDKMTDVAVCEEKREGAEHFRNFDMALYSRKTFGMFGGRDEQVTLRCRNSLVGVILDRFGRDVILCPTGEDCFDVTVNVAVSPLFLAWVMNFGSDIRILSPQSVAEDFVKAAEAALTQYK